MPQGPPLAAVAQMLGDPARANMTSALMDGRALTAGELAGIGGVAPATASGHLGKLSGAGLLTVERQGRHRYYRLSGADVAELVETLMCVSERVRPSRIRTGPRDLALRDARICYDHLAGARAVALRDAWEANGWVEGDARIKSRGRTGLEALGIDTASLSAGRRPACRPCLDWSERRPHLGGALGAALLDLLMDQGWVVRGEARAVLFTRAGEVAWSRLLAPARPRIDAA